MTINKNCGQALVEIILAMTMIAILVPFFISGLVTSRDGRVLEEKKLRATAILQETKEAVRNIRTNGWSNLATNGTYHPRNDGSIWYLQSGTEVRSGYSIRVVISGVSRDSSGEIVLLGGTTDPSTKLMAYTVSWTTPQSGSVTGEEYMTRYNGNAVVSDTTQAEFNTGTNSNTRTSTLDGGSVELSPVTGGITFTDNYDTPSSYTYNSAKIEVTGGFAQLKDLSTLVSGTSSNSNFTTNATGWTYAEWGNTNRVSGGWTGTGGNPSGNIQTSYVSTSNQAAGGYFRQTITTTAVNPTASVSFQWSVSQFQGTPNPDSFQLYVFVDTASGTPVLANAVWSSGQITGVTSWSGTVNVDVSSVMTTPGTYYLKVASYLDYNNTTARGPFQVRYDNVSLSWSGYSSSSYANDSPTITPLTSFSDSTLTAWTSFSTTEVPNGGSVRYQLSADNGSTWLYYSGGQWRSAGATNYNDAATINTRISSFPTANKQILVRAFLIGNGTQQVKLDQVQIGYTGDIPPPGTNSGTHTSASIDLGSNVSFNRLEWVEYEPTDTTVQFQVAINSNNTTWNYVGPDNTGSSYFTGQGGAIPFASSSGRYIRYRMYLSSTVIDLPRVSRVYINYSP